MNSVSFDVKGWPINLISFGLVAPEDLYNEVFDETINNASDCGAPDRAARATAHWAACTVILKYCGKDPVKLAECLRNGIPAQDWEDERRLGCDKSAHNLSMGIRSVKAHCGGDK